MSECLSIPPLFGVEWKHWVKEHVPKIAKLIFLGIRILWMFTLFVPVPTLFGEFGLLVIRINFRYIGIVLSMLISAQVKRLSRLLCGGFCF